MNRSHHLQQLLCILLASTLLGACAFGAGTAEQNGSARPPTGSSAARGDEEGKDSGDSNLETPPTDPAYRLSKGDEIVVVVFNESEFSNAQRIDNRGIIRLPYAGEISIANRTVREGERYLEGLLIEKKLLRDPMVTIAVREYASREVSILGAVGNPGKYRMPREASSVEIVDVVTAMGGLRATAKGDDVQVTRILDSGEEQVVRVDVEAMINPRKGDRNSVRSFLLYPGDRIYVPERLW